MGKAACCEKHGVKRGAWTPQEDKALVDYINNHGHGSWRTLPNRAGLVRCGKSCRLRWINYLRPDIKRGPFTNEEESTIIQFHAMLGNRYCIPPPFVDFTHQLQNKWAAIASQLPGRTDNEIKNYWNTHLKKHLSRSDHSRSAPDPKIIKSESPSTRHMVQWESARVEAEARLSMESPLLNSWSTSNKTYTDCYLQLWHSEVGDSFRMIKGKEEGVVMCQGHVSQEASSSILESCSDVQVKNTSTFAKMTQQQEGSTYKPNLEDADTGGGIESGNYEFFDASESAFKNLLEVPDGDIGFWDTCSFLGSFNGRCD